MSRRARSTETMPPWVLVVIVIGLLTALVWDVLMDVGRMGFF
jgi:hypothetical protein